MKKCILLLMTILLTNGLAHSYSDATNAAINNATADIYREARERSAQHQNYMDAESARYTQLLHQQSPVVIQSSPPPSSYTVVPGGNGQYHIYNGILY